MVIPNSLKEFALQWIPENEAAILAQLEKVSGKDFQLLNGLEVADPP